MIIPKLSYRIIRQNNVWFIVKKVLESILTIFYSSVFKFQSVGVKKYFISNLFSFQK